ncbi:hypothetical protein CL1_1078 [Thermococcus cleftensis]|uniref:MrfA-like Zn-binding domain-containing protein n=1 Tax=Thermococcus cleftensis (strain DSM 27260 / KACC 17922 / CL1) TaxID=163003 RepID=I3ZU97_THECF|nr:DUF1998 domain-containing protein [Thermococcus cleftensis]AFL95281.1 hypothetical protein CL1_1078 [Thermococcus cleftensis]
MSRVQHIRRSQFITTFGPGAIIETTEGPRIVLSPNIGLFHEWNKNKGITPEKLEISHERMSKGYLNGARVFQLPSNAELDLRPEYALYRTDPFPRWSICTKHGILYHQSHGCPKCREELKKKGYSKDEIEKRLQEQGRKQAIRFILACPKGHIGDINWAYEVHGPNSSCNHTSWFYWKREGPALSDVTIECPECRAKVNLGVIYKKPHRCPGTYLERRERLGDVMGCNEHAYAIQRQASNLYVPEIATLFTVPPRATTLHRIFMRGEIRSSLKKVLKLKPDILDNRDEFIEIFKEDLTADEIAEIESYDWEDAKSIILEVAGNNTEVPNSPYELFKEEFDSFMNASRKGFPPLTSNIGKERVLFYVNRNKIRRISDENGVTFRVAPVDKLHTVMVLKGYRRFIGKPGGGVDTSTIDAKLVSVSFNDGKDEWYPGVQLFGEGIFITFDDERQLWEYPNRRPDLRKHYDEWFRAFSSGGHGYREYLFKDPAKRFELHPAFVFWHTLSHLLIRAISVDSGYSAASIRERVYIKVDDPQHPVGGIVLYTSQPNTDGTLGGLVSLVRRFEKILKEAYDSLYSCSNDPLCLEQEFKFTPSKPASVNGAACYACTLISETSCEHRNMWLDRHLLMEWMEGLHRE